MVLVPLAEWKRLKGQPVEQTTPPPTIVEESKTEDIALLLPKSYRARAKIILHFISPRINSDQRVVFSDGSTGAHVIDYLRFVLNSLKTRAPIGLDKFMSVMRETGVPESVYVKRDAAAVRNAKWLTFE